MSAGLEGQSANRAVGSRANTWILVVIAGAQLMVILDTTIMIIALPSAQHALGFSDVDRQWVITAYTLTFGGFLLLGGRISDMVGPKRTLMVGVIGFALASSLGGASQSLGMLIAARGLQGAFGALLAPSVLSLLTTTFTDPQERARAFGVYATIAIGGAAVGLIVGGLLTQYLDWRWCLYVNVPISVIVIFSASALIPTQPRHRDVHLDVPGTLLGCGGLVALVYALGEASVDGWSSADVLSAFAAAAVLLSVFVVLQTKVANPLLPMRIVAERNRAGSFLCIMLAIIANYGIFLFLTYFLQTIEHYSPVRTGFAFLPLMVVNGLAATQLASRLMPRVRTRLLIVPGLLIAAVGAALLTQLTPGASYVAHVLPTEAPTTRSDGHHGLQAVGGLQVLLDHGEDDVLGLANAGRPADDLPAGVEVHVLGLLGVAMSTGHRLDGDHHLQRHGQGIRARRGSPRHPSSRCGAFGRAFR